MILTRLRRKIRRVDRQLRTARLVAKALQSRHHPILAQIVPIRRCNLSCSYCNEFDKVSAPVPIDVMLQRIDRLAALGTTMVDLSGGEPLLHPELDQVILQIRRRGMVASVLTNGYLLTRQRIERLNRAGLDRLQISIDNAKPDDVSHKSLSVLDRKLQLLAAHAEFDVNINTVLGSGAGNPDDALLIARRALELGFGTSVGLAHDGSGQLRPLDRERGQVYQEIVRLGRRFYSHAHDSLFQLNLINGTPNDWQCRAGSRYLYICEDGLVHWCSQQRGHPAIPLDNYTAADLDREYRSEKSCAPFCTVSCVHRVSFVDDLRDRPLETLNRVVDAHRAQGSAPPFSATVLIWLFVTGPPRALMRWLAVRAFGMRVSRQRPSQGHI